VGTRTGPRGARYPIRAVARLTGLSVDTLRAWERRYDVVRPSRDDRGRLYSDEDVRRLQLLAAAVGRGHAIGRLAPLSDAEIEGLIAAPAAPHAVLEAAQPSGDAVGVLLAALAAFDYMAVERELNRLALSLAPRDLVHRVVLPVMKRVGDDWYAERLTIAQEHLISSALRNLLGALVRLYAREQAVRRLLFATPSGERHEFGILAAAMRTHGCRRRRAGRRPTRRARAPQAARIRRRSSPRPDGAVGGRRAAVRRRAGGFRAARGAPARLSGARETPHASRRALLMGQVLLVAAAIVLINLPFGYWRAGVRKFSPAWFVAVHAPVPLAIGLRYIAGMGFRWSILPILVAAFFAGQFIGARLRR
jgi:DNA-binding transcriptional MerR regulator